VNLSAALFALVTDPTYGIPLLIAVGLTVSVAWWSRLRTAEIPPMSPTHAPEFWRIQLDSRAYFTLQRGQYLVAVDGLGRRLATVVREKFHLQIGNRSELDSPQVDRLLPRPLTLRALVEDLTKAYFSAFWAEDPGWVARRWEWWHRRQQRRAARDFARVTGELDLAFAVLEGP
jgi:hypothetical protein